MFSVSVRGDFRNMAASVDEASRRTLFVCCLQILGVSDDQKMKITPTIICKTKQNKKKMIPGLNTSSSLTTHSNKQTHTHTHTHTLSPHMFMFSQRLLTNWHDPGNFPHMETYIFCFILELSAGRGHSRKKRAQAVLASLAHSLWSQRFPRHGLADVSATFNTHTRETTRRGGARELRRSDTETPAAPVISSSLRNIFSNLSNPLTWAVLSHILFYSHPALPDPPSRTCSPPPPVNFDSSSVTVIPAHPLHFCSNEL